jgi:hypothetical protein
MRNIPEKTKYLLDTNVLIGFALWKPIALNFNNNFWSKLSETLSKDDWVLLNVVVDEINKGYSNSELKRWCEKQKRSGFMRKLSDQNKNRGIEINNKYEMIDQYTQKSKIDTYLIAYAEEQGLGIFSRESYRKNSNFLYKIPDVCDKLKIKRLRKPKAFLTEIGFN